MKNMLILLLVTTLHQRANAFITTRHQSSSSSTTIRSNDPTCRNDRAMTTTGGSATTTKLNFNIPTFGFDKKDNDGDDEPTSSSTSKEEKKIGLSSLVQLITAGAGSPFLGDFEGVDEETGKFMFSLEANNLVDEKGQSKQTQAPYFENGWVSEEDEEKEKQKKGGFRFW
eukprot:CAMPEP_0172500946 /NCGR_PEP_ID=MMETSP1066-20121228/144418_1 /TAXON_ID=671091 /ORGANISM="Coscinodiscus wailesii, Strain CCMP2513" /LENGTH=169 /DNA_ID=CAMNT_0013275457 /DNA_START=127 /DNA_END=636 /DNA_ORIENTATION=-